MDNFEDQDLGGLPILKKETPSQEKDLGGLPILKKKDSTPLGSSVTPSPSQNLYPDQYVKNNRKERFGISDQLQVDRGYKPFYQISPIASAVKKDTQKDENLAAGLYNTLVGSIKRLAGGAAYAGELFLGGRPETTITRLASAENARQKTEQFVEKARSEKSSKQYEEAMGKYDFTPKPGGGVFSGVDAEDFKALAFSAPSQAVDMLMGGLTGGSTFVLQSVSDAANELDKTDAGKKLNDAQKATYIFTQAAVQAALEKVSLDLILKNTGLGKVAKQKIANEITDEFVKKGIKATAKDIEEAAFKKASTFANQAKRVGIKAVAGVATEGTTEGTQTAAQEGIKLLTNKIVDKDVFNEEDIIANLGKNIINSSIGGAAFGGVAGGGVGVFQNTNKAIRSEVAKAGKKYFVDGTEVSETEFNKATGNKNVVSDITNIQKEISKQVEEGNITPQEAQAANITAQQYAEIAGKIPTTVSPQDKYKIIGGIEQREALNARKQQAYDELTNLDPVFRKEKQDQIDLIQAKIDETNDYLEGIVSGKKPEYKEKRGMYFKVDSEGNETPINKETYDLAKSIREEDERKAKEPVDTAPAVIMPEENVAPEVVKPSKGAAIIMPEENVPAETTVVRPEQQGKGAAVIIPEANVAPEVAEEVKLTEDVYFNKLHRSEKFDDNSSVSTYLGDDKGEKNIFYTLPNKGVISFKEIKNNTNRFSLTANAKNDKPLDIKNAFKRIEKFLPANHELIEDKSISVDGLRVWNNFIKNDKYIKTGETKEVEITPIDKTNLFKDLKYNTEGKWNGAKFENKDEALARLEKYIKNNNLNFKVKIDGDFIKVEVPILKYNPSKEVKPTQVKPEIKSKLQDYKQKFSSIDLLKNPTKESIDKFIEGYDFNKGKMAYENIQEAPSGLSDQEVKKFNVENSTNPKELVEIYLSEPKESKLSPKEEVIAEGLSKVTLSSFKRFGDKNLITGGMARTYFNKGAKGIDVRAQELSKELDIQPKDIVDFMVKYPSGASAALRSGESDVAYAAAMKFQDLTGLRMSDRVAKKISDKDKAPKKKTEIEFDEEEAPAQFEGGFVPFEEEMDIEGMEEPPFAIEEPTTEEVAQMQDIVKDYIDEGTTSLSEIKKAIAKELGYNTKKLRQTIDDAYNKYTATKEAAPAEVTSGVIGRIGNALKKMFGKEAQKPFIAKDSKALEAKLNDIREDVRFQIEAGFRGTNDMPVAYRYDTDQVARERFDIPNLKQIGAGSDRVVFDLGDGKVLKVAKTPRGLEQNIYEGDYYLSGSIIPEIFERGLNYVVVEKIDPPLKSTKGFDKLNDLLNRIQKFSQKDFDQHNSDLQEIIEEYDMSDIFSYDLLWNDFKAKRNWGLKDGQPLHLDGGSFGGIRMLDKFKGQKPLSDPEFRDIYNKSKKAKIENKDVDKFTKFMATPDADILGFTYKNKMYLNGEKLNPNTPIHEAGHIWVEWTKTNDPKIYAKGMQLVEGSPYLAKAKESKFYQQQTENMNDAEKAEYFKNEALAMAIGDKGAQFVVESKKESFKDWLKTLWTKIKSLTGFKDLTDQEFQDLTFEEFSKMAVKEILGVENDLDQFQAARSIKKKKEFVKGKIRGEANKRAIDDFEIDDMVKLIKADYDLQTLKNIKDAIQKRSTEEVLPSQPRKIGERRGERKRVEPRVEGDEAAGEGEATPTENIEKEWQGAITIAANEERRQMLGLPEYQREKQSFEEWTNKAIKMIKKGYNVEKLLDKMEKGNYSPTPEENQIRKIYVAKLKSDYDANPTPELEKKLIRYTQLNDIVNSQLGRQLRSLADVTEPRETLADFVISKMEANNVDELTEKQRKQVEKQYTEIKKKEEDVEAKLEINDELNAQLLAEAVFKEEKAKRKPYQKTKDYKADRKSIIESIKQKWKDKDKPSDVLMALPFPVPTKKAQQLVAIAPDVNKLMASYIEEGVDDLKEIVSRIYVDLRNEIDGLSEKDIFDVIAGRYKKEKPLLSQLQLKKAELKKEAELIAKIEDIMAGNMPTNEKAKIEQNQRLTQLRNELRDLKKEVGFYDLSKINSLKEKNLEKIKELDEKIEKGDFEKTIKAPSFLENPEFRKKYPKEYEAYIQSVKELSDKKHEFEVSLAKDELKGLTFRDKLVKRWGPEFKNTLSAIKATLDNSFIFIQLGPAIWSNPLLLPKVLNEQRKVIFNEGRFKREIVQIFENKELANLIEVSGLDILDPQTLRESLREEQLGGTDFLERSVEIKGKKYSLATIIKAPFERIAIAAGNYVRLKLFLESVSHLEAQGKTIETHEKEFKDAARIANEMTARGELAEEFKTGKLKTLSSLTWAPKMIGSTINLLGLGDVYNYALGRKGYYASLSPELRKAAIGKMAIAISVPYLAMAALALDDDFEVDYDPRSVTFGQLKQISTGKSWNPYGRFTSVVRYLILMMLGVRYIGDDKMRADFKTETFKFFRGKMAPAYGLGLDLAFREGFDGQPLSFNDVAKDAITPLAIKDLKTYLEDDGTWGLITQGLPALSGIKVGTEKQYNQAKQPLEDVIKKHARTDDTYYSFELKNPSTKEIATKEQFDKFVKERDRLIAEKLTDLYNGYVITDSPNPVPFVSLEANEAGKQISTAKSEATKEAKEIVFGKKKKTAMERLIERKRRLLRR